MEEPFCPPGQDIQGGHHWSAQHRLPCAPCLRLPVCLSAQQWKYELHYYIAYMVNYLGHCVSMAALMAAFLLFLALR